MTSQHIRRYYITAFKKRATLEYCFIIVRFSVMVKFTTTTACLTALLRPQGIVSIGRFCRTVCENFVHESILPPKNRRPPAVRRNIFCVLTVTGAHWGGRPFGQSSRPPYLAASPRLAANSGDSLSRSAHSARSSCSRASSFACSRPLMNPLPGSRPGIYAA